MMGPDLYADYQQHILLDILVLVSTCHTFVTINTLIPKYPLFGASVFTVVGLNDVVGCLPANMNI